MGAPKKADWREERRKRAWKLKEAGWRQKDIAIALGVSEGAVSQWLKRGRAGGIEALNAHPPKGVTPRLSAEQKAQIPELLAKGAEVYGFRGDVWTASRVAVVIERIFGVHYHRDHVGRLLREAGWSRQQPIGRATQRNEAALKQWSEQRWPAIKKKPSRTRQPSSG
jgi:transposase